MSSSFTLLYIYRGIELAELALIIAATILNNTQAHMHYAAVFREFFFLFQQRTAVFCSSLYLSFYSGNVDG